MTTREALFKEKKKKEQKVISMILQTVRELYYPG